MRYKPYDKSAISRKIKDFMRSHRNFRNPALTSTSVAEAVGVARSTFIKVMRDEMDTTFSEYLDSCRLKYARRLVVKNQGRLSMENIASLSGFGSKATFYRKYKAEYGELPTETEATTSMG